jgi:hypothetical protein
MNQFEAIGRKVTLDKERLAKHHEAQALGREISRMAAEFQYGKAAGYAPLTRRVAEAQSLLNRVAVLAGEMEAIDDQLRELTT